MLSKKTLTKCLKTIWAAHHFVYNSKNVADIAAVFNISPERVVKLMNSPYWDQALHFWNYTPPTGDLNLAQKLWNDGLKPVRYNGQDLENACHWWVFPNEPEGIYSKVLACMNVAGALIRTKTSGNIGGFQNRRSSLMIKAVSPMFRGFGSGELALQQGVLPFLFSLPVLILFHYSMSEVPSNVLVSLQRKTQNRS